MSDQQHIKSLVKEAEVYQKQGLLAQSKETYVKILKFVEKNHSLGNNGKLLDAVANRIQAVDKALAGNNKDAVPELSHDVQGLIQRLFAFSDDKDRAAVEGVIALAKFGQYEGALAQFQGLLKKGTMPLVVAKNILRCHLALSSPNEAIDQYERWLTDDSLSKNELENLRTFLKSILERRGIQTKLAVADESIREKGGNTGQESEFLDISSIGVKLHSGLHKAGMVEFEVTFQSGNVISVVVSSKQKDLLDIFKTGIVLPEMQLYSPIAIFKGTGVVSAKTKIKSGPQQGNYMFDIKIQSV